MGKVTYWSPATSTAIIRCPREHYEMVWAALTLTTKLPRPNAIPIVIKVVRVSGTILKAEEEVIRRAKGIIRRAKEVEAGRKDLVMDGVIQAVEKRGKPDAVLAQVDEGEESESDSE
ncbi:RNA-binding protein pop5 [Paraconiothyrium brasiliense]|uniref:RNA-binding protein pop5 n=1 Tax=Paraconiothyrium brasiliense TaxID=300254 RepID=A0ABR3R0T6_9PLEO